MNSKLGPSPPPPRFHDKKRKYNTLQYEHICMKTSHEDSMEKDHKNTGNLDTINRSATNESKEGAGQRTSQPGAKNWNDWFGWVEVRLPVKGG